jgi:hypothetical protein
LKNIYFLCGGFLKTGVPVNPSVCKFTKDVGRRGREENPGNNLQTISYIFRKLCPGALWQPFAAIMPCLCPRDAGSKNGGRGVKRLSGEARVCSSREDEVKQIFADQNKKEN